MRLLFRRLGSHSNPVPAAMTAAAAGLDLMAALVQPLVIEPGSWQTIPTGFAVEIPSGFEGQVRPRSGLAAKHGVTVLNAPGTIDSDYRGELKVILVNLGQQPYTVEHGARIAQLVIAPVTRVDCVEADALSLSHRGEGGFGSTGGA